MYKKYRLGKTRAIYVPKVIAEDVTKLIRCLDKYSTEEKTKEVLDLLLTMLNLLGPVK
jgi:hypothetical protein